LLDSTAMLNTSTQINSSKTTEKPHKQNKSVKERLQRLEKHINFMKHAFGEVTERNSIVMARHHGMTKKTAKKKQKRVKKKRQKRRKR